MIKKMLKWAAVGACFAFAPSAHAVTMQNFVLDAANSSVTITQVGSGRLCNFTSCGISANVVNGLGGSFALATGQSKTFDFLNFKGAGTGGTAYDVTATLAFITPTAATTTGNGSGTAALLRGRIVGGNLSWNNLPSTVILANGSKVGINFQGGVRLLAGKSINTTATVTGVNIVPLPATGLLLLTGLGLVGAGAARRRKAA